MDAISGIPDTASMKRGHVLEDERAARASAPAIIRLHSSRPVSLSCGHKLSHTHGTNLRTSVPDESKGITTSPARRRGAPTLGIRSAIAVASVVIS
ncbi:hypothetical protein EVAR_47259_1 [Eumeta japonica]|uniref:Uncharacterized protein n=1 Tax=Eumeta variegata TaxID=151549 RepID=A0A4C1XIQ2_EUMVA|nr:hypothetical protein EVAR_47259_1 [Eumeta japonica]